MKHLPFHRPVRAALRCVALVGASRLLAACALHAPALPSARHAALIPLPGQATTSAPTLTRSTGQWVRLRLGYSALTYEMPEAPEVLRVENDQRSLTVARLRRDEGRVRFEVRQESHQATDLRGVEDLLANSITEVVARVGGVRRTMVRLTQGGYPAADLVYDFPSRLATVRVRVLVGRWSCYAAMVFYPTPVEARMLDEVARFHGALALDDGDRPDAEGSGVAGRSRYVQPVGAGFAIRMPGDPRRASDALIVGDASHPRVMYSVDAGGPERWAVAVTDFAERVPDDPLAAAVAPRLAGGWRSVAERPVSARGYAGRAYQLTRGGADAAELRVYVARERLYEVWVTHPDTPDGARDARVQAWFDSLRIL